MNRNFLLIPAFVSALILSSCALFSGDDLTPEAQASQAKIVYNIGRGYEVAAVTAANYIHCGEPKPSGGMYLPCLSGHPKPEVTAELRRLDAAAFSAVENLREAVREGRDIGDLVFLAQTAVMALVAYNADVAVGG